MTLRLILAMVVSILFACSERVEPYVEYLNHHDTVAYVGIESCMACHYDIYQTYIQTGMGQSMSLATPHNSEAHINDGSILLDTFSNFSYVPFWHDSVLKIKEIYGNNQRTEVVDYIVGSGHHTNSHLWNENGYVHQMPFTYYTQKGHLDFPPGYENGYNSRFSREIGLECMSCHNAMPDFVMGSSNKYNEVPHGIDCERCHGPGEVHVQRMLAGQTVDTSIHIDYSIVNPKKLSLEAQFQICMRCHLQGNAVLEEGKSFFDFKPGMELSEIMSIFVPRYEDDNAFIMASHVDRLKQSACFNNSEMNCTSCHNPHHSVQKESPNYFNDKCLSCHDVCKEEKRENNDCVSCHMPSSSTIDIPHVTIHDHKIGIHLKTDSLIEKGEFVGLEAINNNNPSKLTRARAYLYQYEKFDAQSFLLDSANALLENMDLSEAFQEKIHLFYLKEDYRGVINVSQSLTQILEKLKQSSYSNTHAWTSYRIAYSFEQLASSMALSFYQNAVDLAPYVITFRMKLANYYSKNRQFAQAEKHYRWVINEFPKNENAWCNLGYAMVQQNEPEQGIQCYDKALALNPRHVQSLLNKASLLLFKGKIKQGRVYLNRVLEIQPENKKVQDLMTLN